jgi:hypothetical protein
MDGQIDRQKFWEELIAYFSFTTYDMDSTEDTASNISSIVACCRGNMFVEPLPNNVRGNIHIVR